MTERIEPLLGKLNKCKLHPIGTDFMFRYGRTKHTLSVDAGTEALYLNLVTCMPQNYLHRLMVRMLRYFPKYKYIVLDDIRRESNELADAVLAWDWCYVLPFEKSLVLTRKPTNLSGVGVRNCELTLTFKGFCMQHQHRQWISVEDNVMTIVFDPPVIFPSHNAHDVTVKLRSPYFEMQPRECGMYPRWDKLCLYPEYDHLVVGCSPSSAKVCKELLIVIGNYYERYIEEHILFRDYAKTMKDVLDVYAKKIQRAWRRCISDPSYYVCRERLLREFYEAIGDASS